MCSERGAKLFATDMRFCIDNGAMIAQVGAVCVEYSEMEFLNDIVSGHKLESQTRVFVWFSNLIFPFYKILFRNRLEFFFYFRGFVCKDY
jgi:hypothetical protein